MWMNQIKLVYSRNKVLIVFLLAICLAGLSCTLFSGIISQRLPRPLEKDIFHVSEYQQADVVNQIQINSTSGKLHTTGEDPFLTFQFPEHTIVGALELVLDKPLKANLELQFFYAVQNFQEENSVHFQMRKGEKIARINIPQAEYSAIRVDFGDKENVLVSKGTIGYSKQQQQWYHLNFGYIVIQILIVFSLLLIGKILIDLGLCRLATWKIHLFFFALLTIVFFAATPTITFDTIWYHTYLDIFSGERPFTAWDPSRGFPFPLLIYISTKLFGYTTQGIMVTMYIFYILFVIGILKIIVLTGYNKGKCNVTIWTVAILALFVNPIYFGYYHLILTEFVATTLMVIVVYTILKTHKEMLEQQKWYDLQRDACVIIICVIAFFLKQMFLICALLPFLISEILLIMQTKTNKRIINTVVTVTITVFLIVGINAAWNRIIDIGNARDFLGREVSNELLMKNMFSNSLSRYFIPHEIDEEKIDVHVNEDGTSLGNFQYNVRANGFINSFKYLGACFRNHPRLAMQSIWENFMLCSNVYHFSNQGQLSGVIRRPTLTGAAENSILGYALGRLQRGDYIYNNTYANTTPSLYVPSAEQYIQKTDTNWIIGIIYNPYSKLLANLTFSLSIILSLPIALFSLYMVRKEKRYLTMHVINCVFSGTIFVYTLMIALLAPAIDRYITPVYFMGLITFANLIYQLIGFIRKKLITK